MSCDYGTALIKLIRIMVDIPSIGSVNIYLLIVKSIAKWNLRYAVFCGILIYPFYKNGQTISLPYVRCISMVFKIPVITRINPLNFGNDLLIRLTTIFMKFECNPIDPFLFQGIIYFLLTVPVIFPIKKPFSWDLITAKVISL